MTTARRVARNTMALSAVSGLRMLVGFALTVYIGRQFGATWLGKYALLLAYVNIFQLASEFGLPRLVTREVVRRPEQESMYFWASLTLQFGCSLVGMAVMAAVVALMGYPTDTTAMLFVATGVLPPWALASVAGALLRARERMEIITLAQAVSSAVQLVATILLLRAGHGVVALAGVQIAGVVLVALVSLLGVFGLRMLQKPQIEWAFAWRLLREAADLFMLAVFGGVLFRLDVLVLAKLLGEEATGLYNAAYQLVKVFMLLAMAYADAIFPALARFYRTTDERLRWLVHISLRYGMLVLLPLAVGGGLRAPAIVRLVYAGDEYASAVPVLRWLVWLLLPFYTQTVLSRTLVASDRQADARRVAGIMVAAGLVYQILLTWQWGIIGTSIAAGLTFLTGAILNWRYTVRDQGRLSLGPSALRSLVAALGMGLILWPLRGKSLPLTVALGIVSYAFLALTCRAFAGKDLALLKQALLGNPSSCPQSCTPSAAGGWSSSERASLQESGSQAIDRHRQLQAFYDEDAATYAAWRWFRNAVTRSDYEMTRQALLAALQPQPGDRVLEVGCGSGTWTGVVAAACAEVVALDISEKMLREARRAVTVANVRFIHADFMNWEADGDFDCLFSVRVFEHLEDKEAALRRMQALLRPGGKVVIITKTVPSIWNGRVRINRLLRRCLRRPPTLHEGVAPEGFWMTRITPWRMLRLLRAVGFAGVEIEPAIWRLPICAGGESEYSLVRGRLEEAVLAAQRRLVAVIRRAPHAARLISTLGSESYVAWAWKLR